MKTIIDELDFLKKTLLFNETLKKKRSTIVKEYKCYSVLFLFKEKKSDFIKSTNHLITQPPTANPPTHRLNNQYSKDLAIERLSFDRIVTQLRKLFWFILYIFSHNFEFQEKKMCLPINAYRWISSFKLYNCNSPHIFQSYLLRLEISVKPDIFLSIYSNSLSEV